jgi:signal transduction histidine kinase
VKAEPREEHQGHLDALWGWVSLPIWQKAAVWLGVWTFMGLLQAARLYIVYHSDGEQLISWAQAMTWALADWYLWGLMSFIIVPVTRRTPFLRSTWLRDFVVHLLCALGVGALQLALYAFVYEPLGTWFEHQVGTSHTRTYLVLYEDLLRGKLHGAVLTYLLIAFVAFALRYAAQYRAAEQRREQLETRLVQARLDALKMQLHPHFLFNTLNAITALIHSDPEAADRMTSRLAELLRATLDSEAVQEVSLRQELEFLEGYLDIQRMRFGARLGIAMNIAPDTLDGYVPNLILQPLVENAVQHGIAPRSGPGTVRVSARKSGDRLLLEVNDDGAGLSASDGPLTSKGRGLSNTRDRLRQLYGDAQDFAVENGAGAGVRVRIDIPFRRAPAVPRVP